MCATCHHITSFQCDATHFLGMACFYGKASMLLDRMSWSWFSWVMRARLSLNVYMNSEGGLSFPKKTLNWCDSLYVWDCYVHVCVFFTMFCIGGGVKVCHCDLDLKGIVTCLILWARELWHTRLCFNCKYVRCFQMKVKACSLSKEEVTESLCGSIYYANDYIYI